MAVAEPSVERVADVEFGFGEGLAWDGVLGRLYFVDAVHRQVRWLDPETANHGSLKVKGTPTVVRLTDAPGVLAVSLSDGLYSLDTADGKTSPIASWPDADAPRMNDAVIDSQGRFVTGHLFFGPGRDGVSGAYWSFEMSAGWRKLDSGKGNTNGPCFSPDGTAFYVADTSFEKIYRFDYDVADGTLRGGQIFADYQGLDGVPDGAKVDSDGYLWSVAFAGSRLIRFAPDGRVDREVELTTNCPTDLVFAGPDLDVAYVTTVGVSLGDTEPLGLGAGGLLRVSGLGVTGLPDNRFRLLGG